MDDVRIVSAGDAAIIIRLREEIDPAINARAVAIAAGLQAAALPGIRDIVPTFYTVAVHYDPLRVNYERLTDEVRRLAAIDISPAVEDGAPITVPVRYGGTDGPDLGDVARFAGIGTDEVVRLHTSVGYRVFMLGFVPGFAYMGSVDRRIAMPRRQTPRVAVPAGSVGIAGVQTGIYPSETPGGWQLIGRTNLNLFDLSRPQVSLFKPGDRVRFVAVDAL